MSSCACAIQLYSTRSGAKRVFVAADVNVPVGAHDIYDEEDFVIALTKVRERGSESFTAERTLNLRARLRSVDCVTS